MNAYGTLMRQRGRDMNVSIRCPECIAANEPDPRFAPPRQYSPENELSSAVRSNATELLVLYGQMVANGSRDMVRQFYAADLRTRINALYDALDRYEAGR